MKNKPVTIRIYNTEDETQLFFLLENEGKEWQDYWQGAGWEKYKKALSSSIAYLIFEHGQLCGYLRCRDDDGYGVYVYDLLIDKLYRGQDYGRLLMEQVTRDFSDSPVYVLGDVYPYYEGELGYEIEGKIYIVKENKHGT